MRIEPYGEIARQHIINTEIEPKDRKAATMIAKGSAASPGAACGKVCFTKDEALAAKANKEDAILVTVMTSQEDVKGMKASRGILTTTGTKVSHAAIMATAWGIPAVVGASEITIDKAAGTFSYNGHTVKVVTTSRFPARPAKFTSAKSP